MYSKLKNLLFFSFHLIINVLNPPFLFNDTYPFALVLAILLILFSRFEMVVEFVSNLDVETFSVLKVFLKLFVDEVVAYFELLISV